jgi:hypothetical protein
MRGTLPIVAGLILVLVSRNARSEDTVAFTNFGPGQESCGKFLQIVENEKKALRANTSPYAVATPAYSAYLGYEQGFLSGANWADAPPHNEVGLGSEALCQMAWLQNFCRINPRAVIGHCPLVGQV